MLPDDVVSRRNILRATGGALAGVGATGLATTGLAVAAPDDTVEVNVGFSTASGRSAARDAASEVVREFESLDAMTVRAPKKAVDALDDRGDVRYVEENGRMETLAQSLPWGIDRVDAEIAHANGETGNGADVAIVDTGIDSDHPELQSQLGVGKAFVSCGGCTDCGFSVTCNQCETCHYPWDDDNGHGTAVAGLVAAADNASQVVGVAPESTLHAVKVLDQCGSGSYSDIAAGVEYVADQGYDVATLAFGGDTGSSVLHDAIQYATNNGVLVVGAAGNDGPCSSCVKYPAKYAETVAVSATTSDDRLWTYSSQGPSIELAAPGADLPVLTCDGSGNIDTASGTSYAAAHVAGAAAQVMANGQSNADARSQLKSTAEDIGLSSNEQGAGLLDVAAALGYDSSDST